MKAIAKVLAYSVAVIVLASVLAPPLYWAGRWAVETDLIPQLRRVPFARYFNRAVLVAALALLWPFLRWFGLTRWQGLGLEPNPRRWRDLAWGAAIGTVGLWGLAALTVASGAVTWKTAWPWPKVGGALATAVAVAALEEAFFRGALFGVLRRSLSWPKALAFLSVFFGILHFIKPHPAARAVTDVDWLTGFKILPYAFHRFTNPTLLAVGLVTLILVGWTLGYTVVRTRSLFLAMGLHGGWVFAVRAFRFVTDRHAPTSVWLGGDLTTGVVPIVLVLLTLGGVHVLLNLRERRVSALMTENANASAS